jgi:hypothetical protein
MATSAPEYESAAEHYGDEAKSTSSENKSDGIGHPYTKQTEDGRYVLQDSDAWNVLGYSFPTWRKWQILVVVFLIQISINLNASIYSHAVAGVSERFHISSE